VKFRIHISLVREYEPDASAYSGGETAEEMLMGDCRRVRAGIARAAGVPTESVVVTGEILDRRDEWE